MVSLRPYQAEAVEAACAALERWRSPVLVMATGTGKTTAGSEVVRRELHRGRALWLAHRTELIDQAAARLRLFGLSVGLERKKETSGADVIVGTWQTVIRRLHKIRGVSLVVVDEVHHAASDGYQKILAHYGVPYLGLTATPGRADGKTQDAEIVYRYGIREAVKDGYLVRPKGLTIRTALDVSRLRMSGGDYSADSVEECIRPGLADWCRAVMDVREDRPTVMFTPGVESARIAAEVLREMGVRAESADGTTPDVERQRILADYEAGELDVLVNCLLWTEGWDSPRTSCVAICRPTRNAGLYQQMGGRGLRLYPGKTDCLILDLGGSGCDLVSETAVSAWGEARVSSKPGEPVDVIDALDAADVEAAARARYVASVEEIELLAGKQKAVKPASLGITWEPNDGVPSVQDAERIIRAGLLAPTCAAEAEAVLAWLAGRAGLCTVRQARMMRRYELDDRVTFDQAMKVQELLAAQGWRNTPQVRALARQVVEGA